MGYQLEKSLVISDIGTIAFFAGVILLSASFYFGMSPGWKIGSSVVAGVGLLVSVAMNVWIAKNIEADGWKERAIFAAQTAVPLRPLEGGRWRVPGGFLE